MDKAKNKIFFEKLFEIMDIKNTAQQIHNQTEDCNNIYE